MLHRHVVLPGLVLGLLTIQIACGSSEGSNFVDPNANRDGGSASSSGFTPPFTPSDSGATSGDPGSCASNVLCGETATCCGTGQECVESACLDKCASDVRCGTGCCTAGQVCLSQTCTNPGKACNDSFDCEENEFCEPTINKCLPQPTDVGACVIKPEVKPLALLLEWSWTGSTILPEYNQVINTPAVVDMDHDGVPEVLIVTSKNNGDAYDADKPGYLRLLEGRENPDAPGSKTPKEKWGAGVDAYKLENAVNPRGTPAVADFDGDGTIEIVAPRAGGGLIAFHSDGSLYWKSTTTYQPGSVTVAIADMDNDGIAEIVEGGLVFNSQTGELHTPTVDTTNKQWLWGANDANYGPVSIIADVDGNDASREQYVVTGNRAYSKNGGVVLWDQFAKNGLTDGYPAIADLDKDGTPELVVIAQGTLRVQNALTGDVIDSITLPGTGRGGPPTIAVFDKTDGFPAIASANGTKYNVFKYDATKPKGEKLSVKWSKDTQDGSSNVTGSSVFDFEGDGEAEVIYNDECYSRVYKGSTGEELYKIVNSSATIHEMPVLVDVDGDNNTELLVVANDVNHANNSVKCAAYNAAAVPPEVPRHGIFAYGDANDRWVRTRKVWNQHAYHITNILADGKLPKPEERSFVKEQNNDYRVSSQGKGVYNAPDIRVDLTVSTAECPTAIALIARVKNAGALGVPKGVKVSFYAGADATGALIEEKTTTKPLLPGESEVISVSYPTTGTPSSAFFVSVAGTPATGVLDECLKDNNSGKAGGIRCPGVK